MNITQQIKELCLAESKAHTLVRSKERQDSLGEVFTPTELVIEIIEQLPVDSIAPAKTVLDPTCGNGQFLAAIAIVKRELGHPDYLNCIYGVDLMQDNVDECRNRLLAIAGDNPSNRATVNSNILCENGLTYDYSFGNSHFGTLFDV